MSKQLEALKQSELLNRLVLDRQTAEEIGRVAQLLLDPQAHRVVGLTCKSGFLGSKKKSFTWAKVSPWLPLIIILSVPIASTCAQVKDFF
ncbi:MAG: hypothetical protein F6J89_32510, partial [Symploca sp. SIO1C4]|nr:hypothetical protein [Symploca sp. SIO1C4]